jgi:hypothetical protein
MSNASICGFSGTADGLGQASKPAEVCLVTTLTIVSFFVVATIVDVLISEDKHAFALDLDFELSFLR